MGFDVIALDPLPPELGQVHLLDLQAPQGKASVFGRMAAEVQGMVVPLQL